MTISREQRIKIRAEQYAKGEMDLKTFFDLESLDEEPEVEDLKVEKLGEPVPVIPEAKKPEPQPKKTRRNKINMTKEEFDKLLLCEQQCLCDENPEGVKELLGVKE